MKPDQHENRSNRLASLAQAGLAALVAGCLLAFSALAFRTGFTDGPGAGVTAAAPGSAAPKPLVLPDAPAVHDSAQKVAITEVRIQVGPTTGTVVLGQRTATHVPKLKVSVAPRSQLRSSEGKDAPHKSNGKGQKKARGNGHHKPRGEQEWNGNGNVTEAREDNDDSWDDDDHDADDSDDSDESGGGSHEGSGGHSNGDSEND